jgi:hypothetical protein
MNTLLKKRLISLQHLIVAIILMTKGFDKIQLHHLIIGWVILTLGIIILIYYIYIKIAQKPHISLEILANIFESTALFLTAYVYFHEGKSLLPYFTLVPAAGFLIVAYLHYSRHKKLETTK